MAGQFGLKLRPVLPNDLVKQGGLRPVAYINCGCLAVSAGFGVNAIPWFKQILKVFVRDPAGHNGRGLKSLWVKLL